VFGVNRTPNTCYPVPVTPEEADIVDIFTGLMGRIGLPVVGLGQLDAPDLVMLDNDGRRILVELKRVPAATPSHVSGLLAQQDRSGRRGALHVLVADRIPQAARAELASHGWGWLDLRGHLHLAGQGLFVDVDVPPVKDRSERTDAFSGPAGLEVVCSLLLDPGVRHGVRDLARTLGRSPSTVSEVLGALRKQGLIAADGLAVLPDLFWETAGAWISREAALADLPRPGTGSVNAALQLGFDDVATQPGWALTGTLAAAAFGAPVAARSDHPPEFYVPSQATFRRAIRLLGAAADPAYRRASIRVAPVPAVCQQRIDPAARQQDSEAWAVVSQHWPLANPLFVALDLAHDPGRGREILGGWQPPRPWRKIW
jgi:Bacterial regulatory protein, arsR family